MNARWLTAVALPVVIAIGTASCADNDLGHSASADQPAREVAKDCGTPLTFAEAAPPEVIANADGWPVPGGDYGNTRAARSTITAANVGSLKERWRFDLPDNIGYGSAATTPVVIGDTVYMQDLRSNVYAIDAATGTARWSRTFDQLTVGPNGVAVGYGMAVVEVGSNDVVALDLETGETKWTRHITRTNSEGIDIQPQIVDHKVLVATVPVSIDGIFVGGDTGVLYALDVATGDTVWSFDTVESGLWGNPDINSGGGAWYTPSVDFARGRVLFGTGNPSPFPGTKEFPNGASRPGDNLYTDSLVVLDLATGALCWFHQAHPHDLFDRDFVHNMITTTSAGDEIYVGTGKGAVVFGYDPDSGAVLWSTPVGRHSNDDLAELSGVTQILPGIFGGVITPPASRDGKVFVATNNLPSELPPDSPSYAPPAVGAMPGAVAAIDAATGRELWATTVDGDPFGGAVAVNDVVMTGTFQGSIIVMDSADGHIVRTIDPGGGMNGWPAVVGDTIYWPVGLAQPAALVAYSLG